MDINEIAFGIFGGYFRRRRAKFGSVRENLMKARIYVLVDRWLSNAAFYSIIGVIFG